MTHAMWHSRPTYMLDLRRSWDLHIYVDDQEPEKSLLGESLLCHAGAVENARDEILDSFLL
jgi:hypothetical protein